MYRLQKLFRHIADRLAGELPGVEYGGRNDGRGTAVTVRTVKPPSVVAPSLDLHAAGLPPHILLYTLKSLIEEH